MMVLKRRRGRELQSEIPTNEHVSYIADLTACLETNKNKNL